MPSYRYKAVLENGKITTGKILATDKNAVLTSLKEDHMQPLMIKEQKSGLKKYRKVNFKKIEQERKQEKKNGMKKRSLKQMSVKEILTMDVNFSKKISSKDLLVFVNDFYILKKAKFNNVDALSSICEGIENSYFKEILEDVLKRVIAGEKLYTSLEVYSEVFPEMFINFIKVGEEAGTLEESLLYVREYIEKSDKLKKTVRENLVPRLLQFVFILLSMFVALIVGVPLLENVYQMFGSSQEIPQATLVALSCAKFLMQYWYFFVIAIVLLLIVWKVYTSTPKGRFFKDKLKLKMPIFGKLNTNILLNNFFQAMLLNLKNGMRIQESLEVSRNITKNYYFASIVEKSRACIANGEMWYKPFVEKKIFNKMMTQMIEVGMKSNLAEILEKVNEYIAMEVNTYLKRFTKLLPEITYLIVGIMLVIFTIVVLVPLINLYMGGFIEIPA